MKDLVEEVASTCHVHGDASFLGSSYDLFVTDGTTWLDNCLHTGINQDLQTVSEREEGIGRSVGPLSTVFSVGKRICALNGELCGVHAVDLAHADADGGVVLGQQDGVGLHSADGAPCKLELSQLFSIQCLAGGQLPVLRLITLCLVSIRILGEQTTRDKLVLGCLLYTSPSPRD